MSPLSFSEMDDRAKDVLERRVEVISISETDRKFNNRNTGGYSGNQQKSQTNYRQDNNRPVNNGKDEFKELLKVVKGVKVAGKEICIFFNTKMGCKGAIRNCDRSHVCAKMVKNKTELCKGRHSRNDCRN